MNGEFKQSLRKYIFCLFFILSGSFIAIRFSLWGIEEIQLNHTASSVFCFTFAVFGLLFGFLSIFVFQFNRKAFLKIEDGKIEAQFGWGEELYTELNNIANAENQGKHLKLYIDDSVIWIYNLVNAKDLCQYILSHISNPSNTINIEEAKFKHQKNKQSFIKYLIATIIAGAFLFIHIGWCVFLTEGKDLTDFSKLDDVVFLAFAFSEIFTIIIAFLLASKCGKKLAALNITKFQILSANAVEHKNDALDKYPNVITKKYFDHYTYRIVVFSPKENIFAYMLERFDIKTLSWMFCYESAKGFEILSDLYEELDSSFEDVIFED